LIQDLSFTEDNVRLLSGSLDGKIKLWDINTGKKLLDFDTGTEVWTVDLVSAASIIVFGCEDGTVRVLRRVGKGVKK